MSTRALQEDDVELLHYFQYLEDKTVPVNERDARRIVLECEKIEVIEGVLHHKDTAVPARWCVVVPKLTLPFSVGTCQNERCRPTPR